MKPRYLNNERGFLSDYFLGSVLARGGRSSGLTDRAADAVLWRFTRLRERAESRGRDLDAATCRERFLRPLLRDTLGFHLGEGEERVHPLYAAEADEKEGKPPLLLVYCGGWDEDLSAGKGASPVVRLEKALAAKNLRHGLLATGERMRLIRAAGDGPKGAYLEADLAGMSEDADPGSFGLFLRLFHASAFVPGASGKAPIDEIEQESRQHAEKVSEDLKGAVFTAAEELTGAILAASPEADLRLCRDAALTALYRVLFILYAEARDPRLQQHRLYQDSYSVEGLVRQLFEEPARAWAANSCGLWERLRAAFRIYDQGLPKTDRWDNIPARGGKFFSALTAEGKLLESVRLPDSVVSGVILSLAATAPRHGVGLERVSFAELDIESLGAVYEGLLEYEPRVAKESLLEVRAKGGEYALAPVEVVRLCRQLKLSLKDPEGFASGTEAEALVQGAPEEEDSDESEVEAEEEQEAPARGGWATVVRRLEPGRFFFIPGAGRKGSGSFYTPLPLVRDLIEHALGPFVRGKSAAEIESLRVLDPACGSAHFLVEAMRFMGAELHRAYSQEFGNKRPPAFTHGDWDAEWKVPDEQARAANSEARAWCKRRIAERCLFGVDYNPTAASLARVALWIESLAGDRPLSYFDHHVRCGNALLGTWLERLDKAPHPNLGDVNLAQDDLFSASTKYIEDARKAILEAAKTRRLIDKGIEAGLEPDSIEELTHKRRLKHEGDDMLEDARLLFDLRSAAAFLPAIWAGWSNLCSHVSARGKLQDYAGKQAWWPQFEEIRARERFFHWEIEFPEVFLVDGKRGGFDVVLANPPWDKVLPSKHDFYASHDPVIRIYKGNDLETRIQEIHRAHPELEKAFDGYQRRVKLVAQLLKDENDFPLSRGRTAAAHEDLSKFFLEKAMQLLRDGGALGMVIPAVVYNGDGCAGLRRALLETGSIERFYGFENREKLFPIDSRYKFANLVFRKGVSNGGTFNAAFMRHDIAELAQYGAKDWIVRMTREEVEQLSPNSFAFLEFRSRKDQEIVHKMHEGRKTLGDSGPGSWNAHLFTDFAHMLIYNATRDKDLWSDSKTKRLYDPKTILSRVPNEISALIEAMARKGFWPVMEGKHIEQFLVGIAPIRWWLSVEQAKRKYNRDPRNARTLVFRETASNTNERTSIAAVLPAGMATSHKLSGVLLDGVDLDSAATLLNSFCFDYALRFRTAGTSISFTYIRPMPVPPPDVVNRLPKVVSKPAWECGLEHISGDRANWPKLWDSNRAVAEAYGLGPADFEHILASFPGFAKKRPQFHAYLLERLTEWKAEAPASARRRASAV